MKSSFPRDLEQAVLWALPVAIFKFPRLSVQDVTAWVRRYGVPLSMTQPERGLHACLLAYGGKGCALLNGADPPEEQRFSLAHEVAHFLLDYLEPRQRAIHILGTSIADVLDGRRAATLDERVHAVLANVPLGVHVHLLDRREHAFPDGSPRAESLADRLALELLAPEAEVRRAISTTFSRETGFPEILSLMAEVLVRRFGLPGAVALWYGRALCWSWRGSPTVREWLGLELPAPVELPCRVRNRRVDNHLEGV